MKFVLRFFAVLHALVLVPACLHAQDLRVMTFNVRYPNPDDQQNVWANRKTLFIGTVEEAGPDLMGTQELFKMQGDDVVRALPQYRWIGRDRFGGHGNEHMGIFYKPQRLTLLRHGDFWLSDTPGVPGSIGWGATLPRMVNWAMFRTKGNRPYNFVMVDTHFANRDVEDEVARQNSAHLLAARLARIAHGLPVVLTADLNSTPDSVSHRILMKSLVDVWQTVGEKSGPDGTFHDFTGVPGPTIDFIMERGFKAVRATVITRHRNDVYPSDHFPVVAVLRHPSRDCPEPGCKHGSGRGRVRRSVAGRP